jgi:4-amino-4-deoxy-L-arabinose transferase-like glycosyltransferase
VYKPLLQESKQESRVKSNTIGQDRTAMIVLFVLSLAVRLLALWMAPSPILSTNAEIAYLGGARLILEGEGLKDPAYPIFTPPLYAMFIALGSFLFDAEQLPIKIFQIVLDSLTAAIVYAIVRELIGPQVAVLSGLGWALYPFAIYATLYIGSEAMFTFLLCLFLWLAVQLMKRPQSWQLYCAAGAVLGLATLTRGTTQFLPLFLLGVLIIFYRRLPKGVIQGYLIFFLSFAAILSPWAMRNYLVLHEFVPVGTGGGVLLQGASDEFLTIENKARYSEYYERLEKRGIHQPPQGSGPVEMDRFFVRAGLESYKIRLENDPLSLFPFMTMKFFRLWYATESGNNEKIILGMNSLIYALALIGLWLSWTRGRQYLYMVGPIILYFILLHWLTLPLFRYVLPVLPLIIVFAGMTVFMAYEWLVNRSWE